MPFIGLTRKYDATRWHTAHAIQSIACNWILHFCFHFVCSVYAAAIVSSVFVFFNFFYCLYVRKTHTHSHTSEHVVIELVCVGLNTQNTHTLKHTHTRWWIRTRMNWRSICCVVYTYATLCCSMDVIMTAVVTICVSCDVCSESIVFLSQTNKAQKRKTCFFLCGTTHTQPLTYTQLCSHDNDCRRVKTQ